MRRILAIVCAGLLALSLPAQGAVTPNSVVTPQTPTRGIVQFLQGTDSPGTYKTLYTGGTNGSKCIAIWENNNDGSATHLVTIEIVNSTVKYGGIALTTVSNEGYGSAVPARNFFSTALWPGLPNDSDGNPFIFLASGDTLQATYATTLTSSDKINLVAVCMDY